MSDLKKKNRVDYSKYDEMGTEALEEILRLDFQMSEEAESDIDAILYISEVIARREKNPPDVGAAWEQFNTKYRPYVTDGRSLYDFGDEDGAPGTVSNNSAVESDSPIAQTVERNTATGSTCGNCSDHGGVSRCYISNRICAGF